MSSCQRTERCCAIGTELPLSYAPIWLPLVHGPSGCGAVCTTAPLPPPQKQQQIGGDAWVRYDDPEAKTFKLNVERQNGRAAMLGTFGCILHEVLGVDALYPTGGMGGEAPPTIF